jgi:hypothetical protein
MTILQQEVERFEKAIVTTSSAGGGQGITLLPGVRSIIDEVCPILANADNKVVSSQALDSLLLGVFCRTLAGQSAHLQPGHMLHLLST